jgi:hypothetical protein
MKLREIITYILLPAAILIPIFALGLIGILSELQLWSASTANLPTFPPISIVDRLIVYIGCAPLGLKMVICLIIAIAIAVLVSPRSTLKKRPSDEEPRYSFGQHIENYHGPFGNDIDEEEDERNEIDDTTD